MTKGRVQAFFGRGLDELQVCRLLPQEHRQLIAPRVHKERVFNLDKVGSFDWEDRKPRKAIAARAVSLDDVHRQVSCR
jgi:hypothetical protein